MRSDDFQALGAPTAKMSKTGGSPRLAIVLSHPNQYYSPWFRWLKANTTLKFRVFYLWEFGVRPMLDPLFQTTFAWDVDLLSGYDHEFVANASPDPGTHRFSGLHNPSLGQRLCSWRPDALLLYGYAYRSNLQAVAWARWHGVPLIFRGDSHFIGRSRPALIARLALRMLYAQFAAFAYVGVANREYFTTLHVPDHKLFFAPHAVDHTRFDPTSAEVSLEAAALRQTLGLHQDTRAVVYAGKLIPAKQPRELLRAFLALQLPGTALVFVGEGQEKAALVELARTAPAGSVHFLPFANQSGMPSRYLLADIFALPSRGCYETWGLAVNEAMEMGVPCLVSDRVGCQRDLVTPGKTGWVFRANDFDDLRSKLADALTADLSPFRKHVTARISAYGYASAAEGLLQAIAATPAVRR